MYVDWSWWMENTSRITYVKKKKKGKENDKLSMDFIKAFGS